MIAHVDADSFFASVLVRKDPSLRGKPLLALGMGGGCVIAASYEAKAKGVKTGMTVKDALKLAPDALRIHSDFQETGLASDQIESVIRDVCPRIEQMSIDEWFLDLRSLVGGVPADLHAFASALRQTILERTGLSVSAGIAPTKTLAKMASEYRKPGGITVVKTACHPELVEGRHADANVMVRRAHHDTFATTILPLTTFLTDRPAAAIPGIGTRRIAHCEAEGWKTAWDIAKTHPEQLKTLFGKPGRELHDELNGIPVYAVIEDLEPPQSISRARSFQPSRDTALLWAHTLRHLEYTILKMRRWRLACKGISVWIRDGEYKYRSSHCSLPRPLETEETLQPFVRRCFGELLRKNEAYTQAGLALWKLVPGGTRQFSLFEEPGAVLKEEKLQDSLDTLHEKFGRNAITRGSALPVKTGTKRSFEMPVYE
ncbi:MAG: DNA polymerase IV [Candidatus Peribacteraceae bacterium]|nr:DNA polymerase IV [Candidatus Peribacteraceae bacterium]